MFQLFLTIIRVNRKAFKIMCGGTLTSPIQHPSDPNSKLFFLFDTVHLFKCIRNNWLNVKIPPQTFQFPPFDDDHEFDDAHSASFSVLKTLYETEKNLIVKQAPSLSAKVLYPSSMECQNVNYVVKLFDEKNVAALQNLNITNHEPVCNLMNIVIK